MSVSRHRAKKNRRQQKKENRELVAGEQRQIRDGLLFRVPTTPRLYLLKSLFGPKERQRIPKADRDDVATRPLKAVPHNGTTTHVGIPNPNYVPGSDIPQYAAIRFAKCVSDASRGMPIPFPPPLLQDC
jgi:hypothetical protein